jgi:hypothetical protein
LITKLSHWNYKNLKLYYYYFWFFCTVSFKDVLLYCFISVLPSFRPSQDIFHRYAILWEAFLDPSDSYFLFADLVDFYTHWTYMRGYHKWALAHSSSC